MMPCIDYTKTSPNGSIPDPERFRAQATGIGQTVKRSKISGMMRSERVASETPEHARKFLKPNGYPKPLGEMPKY
jgi:hypothetical protein